MYTDAAVSCDENKKSVFKEKPVTSLHVKYFTLMGSTWIYNGTWTHQLSTLDLDNEGKLRWDKVY